MARIMTPIVQFEFVSFFSLSSSEAPSSEASGTCDSDGLSSAKAAVAAPSPGGVRGGEDNDSHRRAAAAAAACTGVRAALLRPVSGAVASPIEVSLLMLPPLPPPLPPLPLIEVSLLMLPLPLPLPPALSPLPLPPLLLPSAPSDSPAVGVGVAVDAAAPPLGLAFPVHISTSSAHV